MLRKIWTIWKAFGEFMGNILSRVVLTIFYFTIFVPFAAGTRIFSDRLGIKTIPEEYWQQRNIHPETIEEARRQA